MNEKHLEGDDFVIFTIKNLENYLRFDSFLIPLSLYKEKLNYMDVKEHILQETQNILSRMGPQSMTMDMVARNCGISKRTLYEKFPDKETLIGDAINAMHNSYAVKFDEIFKASRNSLEALLATYLSVRSFLQGTSAVFLEATRRLYPDIFMKFRETADQHMGEFGQVISKAQDEGLILRRIDPKIAAYTFFLTINKMHDDNDYSKYGDQIKMYDMAFIYFLRGIATIKGIEFIDNYIIENLIGNEYKNNKQ